jgi:hypothetical protein
MRCKVGDLAVVCAPTPYAGHFVQCVALHGKVRSSIDRGPHWWVTPHNWDPGCSLRDGSFLFPDSMLRPIRDNDGEDEMLRIAGKPTEMDFPEWSQQ